MNWSSRYVGQWIERTIQPGRWKPTIARLLPQQSSPSLESSCQLAPGARTANSCDRFFLRQEELASHPFRVISVGGVTTQHGKGAAVDCRTRKQFPSLKSDFRVTVGGGGAGIDGILHAHTFCTTTPIILAITPRTTGGAANREQSGLSSREASAVTSQSSGCGLKIRGQTVRWQTSSVVARVGAIGPCCSATCHPGMSR